MHTKIFAIILTTSMLVLFHTTLQNQAIAIDNSSFEIDYNNVNITGQFPKSPPTIWEQILSWLRFFQYAVPLTIIIALIGFLVFRRRIQAFYQTNYKVFKLLKDIWWGVLLLIILIIYLLYIIFKFIQNLFH